jgi:hypothetical protein
MNVIAACATEDGKFFTERTFADAPRYVLYRIGENDYEWLKAVANPTRPEDPEEPPPPDQARTVGGLLRDENVQVLLGARHEDGDCPLCESFVPVRIRHQAIGVGIHAVMNHLPTLLGELADTRRKVIELD